MPLAAASVPLPNMSLSRVEVVLVCRRLRAYHARYAPFFGRRELQDEPRKSIERMILRRRGANANALRMQQMFLHKARWDDTPTLTTHRELVAATLGEDEVDRRLYLSQTWVSGESQAARRQRTGVPADIPFHTKPQLTLEMLAGLVAEGSLPVRWVIYDEGFGYSPAFLDGVAALGLDYLAEVPRTTHVWTARLERSGSPSRPVFSTPSQEVGTVTNALLAQAWQPFVLRVVARRGR